MWDRKRVEMKSPQAAQDLMGGKQCFIERRNGMENKET